MKIQPLLKKTHYPPTNHYAIHQWLAGGYDLEIGHFRGGYSMVVSWWRVGFFAHSSFMIGEKQVR